ncbi:hypothetical protein KTO58_03160 [Chitinophaga pendula]|uniref:hypothetical protein n=1 Tax=Chitinophaga TaxID=79328 RepID=UPI000BAF06C7|nr:MULTISPECIES: hypothetical protein [Chitinophaga]ASZ14167.1 hypothetical protein CK934_26060 [Chitinophaga sp. MD30]UCJ08198.1 hypothetical protein KTO58_03160 [Chitinophaga pendula]
MAISRNNALTQNLSGLFAGVLVFRQLKGGRTVMARVPHPSSKPPTSSQVEARERFLEASYYAKSVLKNPELREGYLVKAKDGQSAMNLALRDYIQAPEIRRIDTASYTGQPGQVIVIKAFDDFKVTGVSVFIYGPGNVLIEAGAAILPEDSPYWRYTVLLANNNVVGGKIVVYAKDLPGNVTTKEQLLL